MLSISVCPLQYSTETSVRTHTEIQTLQMRSRKYHLQISETKTIKATRYQHRNRENSIFTSYSLQTSILMLQWKITKATSTLHTKESSMQLQTRTGANPCKRKPGYKQRRNNVLYCRDGQHDRTEGQIPSPPAMQREHTE